MDLSRKDVEEQITACDTVIDACDKSIQINEVVRQCFQDKLDNMPEEEKEIPSIVD